MGVPILYAGSKYYPGIPPDKQYPVFSSAEVGNVNASTVSVTFSVNVSASNYATGVTIKVNGSAATISSATRQANHAVVYYALSAAVVNGNTVTWEYSGGNITNEATGAALQTTSAQSVTNNVSGDDFMQTTVTIHHSDILTIPTKKFEIVSSPGTGKAIIPIAGFVVANFPTAGYTASSTIELAVRYGLTGGRIISHYIGGIDWLAAAALGLISPIAFPKISEGSGAYTGNFFMNDSGLSTVEDLPPRYI